MTYGLVHASYSLPKWQAVKLTFFAPCLLKSFCKVKFGNFVEFWPKSSVLEKKKETRMPDFPLGKQLSNSLVGGWLPWTFAHWVSTYIVSFKSYLPSKKIYLSWTAGWDISRALSHGSERLRTKLHENHTLSCSTFLYTYGLDKGVYPPSPPHRISNHVSNCA